MELPDFSDNDSFSWHDLYGDEKWLAFTPVFTSLTVVGATAYLGRYRFVGRKVEFQVQFSAATSVASVAGTTYLALPITPANGLAGMAVETDVTTNIAVGVCHIDVTNSRCYTPTKTATSDVLTISGWYEI